MNRQPKNLGEYLYENLKTNIYLHKLMGILTKQYAFFLLHEDWNLTNKQKQDLLRFADLLVKSISTNGINKQKNMALKIVALLMKMYPEDPSIEIITNEVLDNLNNFLPRKQQLYRKIPTMESLWDGILRNYQMKKRQIPGQRSLSFVGKQDIIFQSLDKELNSFSAPTSMGKTFLIEKYIEFQIKSGVKQNFAMTVPSKALITEVRSQFINDLGDDLIINSYRVISHLEEYNMDLKSQNFIFVMTPERLYALMKQYPDVRFSQLFVDESQKAAEVDQRSIFYYEIFDQLSDWETNPKITFASPLVPNPEIFQSIVNVDEPGDGLRVVESPVIQVKFIIDRYNKNLKVYDDLNKKTIKLGEFKSVPSMPQIILAMQRVLGSGKCNLIYYGSKAQAISDAVVVSREIADSTNPRLIELAEYISRKIHPDYILAKLVKKGIAFHIGELPIDIRTKIEEVCRNGDLKLIFCTSTLLEGVNLPADNLFITSLQNGFGVLSQLEFLNLVGRVGRLNHSMLGNVFLVTGEKEKSHSNLQSYLKRLNDDPKKVRLSFNIIKPKQAMAIKKSLENGDVRLDNIEKDKNYDLIRKLSLLYVQELNHNKQGVVRKCFSKTINPTEEKKILKSLQNRYGDKLEDDINFSSDQSEKLMDKINKSDIKEYPSIHRDNKLNVLGTVKFLQKLADIFNWSIYEKDFIGGNEDPKTQAKILEDYSKLLLLWMSGYSLNRICSIAIWIRNNDDSCFLDRLDKQRRQIHNIDWNTITINAVMHQLQKIQFVLGKYFLKVTQELTNSGIQLENDWYRFLEYGTDSDLRIWLQQNGYSRESSEYIQNHQNSFIIQIKNNWFIFKRILKAHDVDVVNETKEIQVNVPDIFI